MQKTQAFVDGIRDADTKRTVMVSPKNTFSETVGFALAQETAVIACSQHWKVRRTEIEDDHLESMVCQAVKVALKSENKGVHRGTLNCFFCERPGHFSRDCRLRQKWIQEKRQTSQRESSNQVEVCYFCEKKGHTARECNRRRQWVKQHNYESVAKEEEDKHLN